VLGYEMEGCFARNRAVRLGVWCQVLAARDWGLWTCCQSPTVSRAASDFHQVLWLASTLIKVRNGAQALRDVRNEGTTGDVYENKGEVTKCPDKNTALYTKMHQFAMINKNRSDFLAENTKITR